MVRHPAKGVVGFMELVGFMEKCVSAVRYCGRLQLWVVEPQGCTSGGLDPQRGMTVVEGNQGQGEATPGSGWLSVDL